MLDLDLAEGLVLLEPHHAALEEIEDRQEVDDHDLGRGLPVEKVGEGEVLAAADHAVDRGHRERDRQAARRDVLGLQKEGLAAAVDVCADDCQASKANALQVVGHKAQELRVGAHGPGHHAALRLGAGAQGGSRRAELLIGYEAGDQDFSRLVGRKPLELLVFLEVVALANGFVGHKGGRLDVKEGRRHQDEVARDLEVEVLHALDLLEVLVGDLRDRDRADGDLLAVDQLKQQVEGTGIGLRANLVAHLC